jgi:hypothetical protein
MLKDRHFSGPQWGAFAIDTANLILFLLVALRSGRYWPLFAAAFQLLAVITHVASTMDRHLSAWAAITASVIWTYLILGALAVGTWNVWRGRYPAASADPITDPGATLR